MIATRDAASLAVLENEIRLIKNESVGLQQRTAFDPTFPASFWAGTERERSRRLRALEDCMADLAEEREARQKRASESAGRAAVLEGLAEEQRRKLDKHKANRRLADLLLDDVGDENA